jgi:hypothetical protein
MNAKPPKPERITPPEAASLLSGLDVAVVEMPGSSTGAVVMLAVTSGQQEI